MTDVTRRDAAVDAVIEVAIASLLSTFSTIKLGDVSEVMDRTMALRHLTKRIVFKNRTDKVRPRTAATN